MNSYTTTFLVKENPDDVFAAISDVRGWWSGEIEGRTDTLGEQFTYRYEDIHHSTQQITAMVPGKKISWHICDAYLAFIHDPTEWVGTDITFEITDLGEQTEMRFTHVGLNPDVECFDTCSNAWGFYINTSLRNLITSGTGTPNQKTERTEAGRS